MILGAGLVVVGVAMLLYADKRDRPVLRWIGKPTASAGFLLAALNAPELQWPHGIDWMLLGALGLSAAGDVLLVPKGRSVFLAGMAAFGLAHVLYAAWFLSHTVAPAALALAVGALLVIGHVVWMWLAPHVPNDRRLPVRVYVLLVSLMAATAAAYGIRAAAQGTWQLLPAVGGLLLYASDVAVARQRFVAPAFANRAWGLPAYYLGQLLLASALAS